MPDYQFVITISNISQQRAANIRDRMTARLGEDNVVVTSISQSRLTRTYVVHGVDTATSQVFHDTIEAIDADDAAAQAQAVAATRVIVNTTTT